MTIEELKRALEAATPRDWEIKRASNGEIIGVVDGFGREVMSPDHDDLVGWKVSFDNPNDARLIVEAVNNLPALLKVVEAAQTMLDDGILTGNNTCLEWENVWALRKALEELNDD